MNVWCAAGKRTFSTDELVRRVEATNLAAVVRHRTLVLPQLGAPGVAAHEVKARTGFVVEWGPVRARDLPAYLRKRHATPEMRRVRFSVWDRAVVIPVELAGAAPWVLGLGVLQYLTGGARGLVFLGALVLAGIVLFPLLLPWLPTRRFSTKGFILGAIITVPLLWFSLAAQPDLVWWRQASRIGTYLLEVPAVVAFLALNFTGSTTFTSRTGVRKEIFRFVPVMAGMFGAGLALDIATGVIRRMGGA